MNYECNSCENFAIFGAQKNCLLNKSICFTMLLGTYIVSTFSPIITSSEIWNIVTIIFYTSLFFRSALFFE